MMGVLGVTDLAMDMVLVVPTTDMVMMVTGMAMVGEAIMTNFSRVALLP